ncbi:MAG: hypothetical protein ABL895_04010 [Cyclobacteriaceae bacterium]
MQQQPISQQPFTGLHPDYLQTVYLSLRFLLLLAPSLLELAPVLFLLALSLLELALSLFLLAPSLLELAPVLFAFALSLFTLAPSLLELAPVLFAFALSLFLLALSLFTLASSITAFLLPKLWVHYLIPFCSRWALTNKFSCWSLMKICLYNWDYFPFAEEHHSDKNHYFTL